MLTFIKEDKKERWSFGDRMYFSPLAYEKYQMGVPYPANTKKSSIVIQAEFGGTGEEMPG